VRNGKASAAGSTFHFFSLPLVYLPYVTHPVEGEQRQTGFMIPTISQSSTKGIILGEEIYFALNRSMDLMVGAEYFSRRGWQTTATFRYKGQGLDFANAHYSGLLDRGYTPNGGVYTNQGGEDVTLNGRKDLTPHLRAAADVEYLSSYVYREAFTNNFNQAVTSDINSNAYIVHENNGIVSGLRIDRYQGLKNVRTGEQVRIFHAPSLDVDILERHLGKSPLVWSAENSLNVLKRVQNNFSTDISERLDVHPKISLPFGGWGWKVRPSVGVENTFYTHSRVAAPLPGTVPVELDTPVNRTSVEAEVEVRTPVVERVFETGLLERMLGRTVKHTIEPIMKYRYVTGVDNYTSILRFDPKDVVVNTNEVEYGVTQRLFLRPTRLHPCGVEEIPETDGGECGGTRESLRWRLSQKRFFNENFGGALVGPAVVAGQTLLRRNVLEPTLDFSGVAFLTEAREVSPILSEMRLSATEKLDVEWDMNYDTHAGKFTASNVFLNYHAGNYFGGVSHARLNAPGRFQQGTVVSQTSDFSQLRLLMGYGTPTKEGISLAANVGLNLNSGQTQGVVLPGQSSTTTTQNGIMQYGALQANYNWNCCGVSVEYRKFELGPVRNENVYRFSFTLANIGSAGNLRRTERLF
jgi:LPS-assembly protein